MTLSDHRLLCIAASHGLGIVQTGSKMIFPEAYQKTLKQVLPGIDFGEVILTAFYKYTQHDQPKVRVLLDHLEDHMKRKLPPSHFISNVIDIVSSLLKPQN